MAWIIPRDFNFKKPDWPKILGVFLIIEGIISIAHPKSFHGFYADRARVIRIGIGSYLLSQKNT